MDKQSLVAGLQTPQLLMKNLIIEYKSVMLYRILIIIFTFSLVSAQSLFNRWNGSNPFVGGSPYSDINEPFMSTGRRIARSIKKAIRDGCLDKILS